MGFMSRRAKQDRHHGDEENLASGTIIMRATSV